MAPSLDMAVLLLVKANAYKLATDDHL